MTINEYMILTKHKKLILMISAGIVAVATVSLLNNMFAIAERPVGIAVTKVYSGPAPEGIKSVAIPSSQLLPILHDAIGVVEANHVNGAVYPLGFQGQITQAEANQLMKILPFTELTKPDETFRSFYAIVQVDSSMYQVALYIA